MIASIPKEHECGNNANIGVAIEKSTSPCRQVQLAADAQWPASIATNADIRAEFKLPPDRVLK